MGSNHLWVYAFLSDAVLCSESQAEAISELEIRESLTLIQFLIATVLLLDEISHACWLLSG
jgi:hypothetical protein